MVNNQPIWNGYVNDSEGKRSASASIRRIVSMSKSYSLSEDDQQLADLKPYVKDSEGKRSASAWRRR